MSSTFFGFTQYFGKHSGFEIFKITMGFTVIVKSQISAGARNLVCPMLDLVLHFWQVVGLSVVCGEERTEIFAEATMLSSQAHQELQDPAHLLNIFPGCGQSSLLCSSYLALFSSNLHFRLANSALFLAASSSSRSLVVDWSVCRSVTLWKSYL